MLILTAFLALAVACLSLANSLALFHPSQKRSIVQRTITNTQWVQRNVTLNVLQDWNITPFVLEGDVFYWLLSYRLERQPNGSYLFGGGIYAKPSNRSHFEDNSETAYYHGPVTHYFPKNDSITSENWLDLTGIIMGSHPPAKLTLALKWTEKFTHDTSFVVGGIVGATGTVQVGKAYVNQSKYNILMQPIKKTQL